MSSERCKVKELDPALCLFKLYAEYIMRNAGLEEAQAGIKIAGRNINHLRYADDTTLMAESEEELKSLLMKVKEESEKVGFELKIQKIKIKASGPITSWQIICPVYIFFGDVSVQIIVPPFQIWLFILLLLSFQCYLYILNNSPLSKVVFLFFF